MTTKDHVLVWSGCIETIKNEVGQQSFDTWFRPIVPQRLVGDVLTIQVPSQFFYEWLEEHYVHVLKKAITKELGITGKLEYSVIIDKGNNDNKGYSVSLPTNTNNEFLSKNNRPNKNSNFPNREEKSTPAFTGSLWGPDLRLNQQYTFENYVEGDCNRLARSAGIAVANKPGFTSFNPLMVYSEVGLGKTHLVQAIGNRIMEINPSKSVLYVSSEKFANQVIEAFKNGAIQDLANHYLKTDVLIIDDVQFFAGKEKTQEIFFHIFNHLHQSGKQLVLTLDRPPKELKGLEERLISRFKWGLSADLQKPDYETRKAIIYRKIENDGILLSDEVIDYLAQNIASNIRELEGVVISLLAQASLARKDVDLELARSVINNIVEESTFEIGIDYIQKYVSEYFGVSIELMKAKTRKREIVEARQIAMYLAKNFTDLSLKAIGYNFGNRDHSTVIHAITTVNDMMDTNRKFNATIQEILGEFSKKAG